MIVEVVGLALALLLAAFIAFGWRLPWIRRLFGYRQLAHGHTSYDAFLRGEGAQDELKRRAQHRLDHLRAEVEEIRSLQDWHRDAGA